MYFFLGGGFCSEVNFFFLFSGQDENVEDAEDRPAAGNQGELRLSCYLFKKRKTYAFVLIL